MNIEENVFASSLTTIKIGGKISYFIKAYTHSDIIEAINYANRLRLSYKVVGGGSNIIFPDEGYNGVVIRNCIYEFTVDKKDKEVTITAGAGIELDKLVHWSVVNNLSGIELLSWIPGSIGAAPIQNVGAYGQSISDVLVSVEAIDTEENQSVILSAKKCDLRYRDSIFKSSNKGRYIITKVNLKLKACTKPKVYDAQLNEVLKGKFEGSKTSLMSIRYALFEIRARKGMVLDALGGAFGTVGSFFINPEVDVDRIEMLKNSYPDIVFYQVNNEKYRIPAAWLIGKAGFEKGYRLKNVGISPFHNLALVTYPGGTRSELLTLCEKIQGRVKEKFGIDLVPEPDIV